MPYTIPEGRRGPTPGAGLQELSGVPLILRAMLDEDERVRRLCGRVTHQCFGQRWHPDDSRMEHLKTPVIPTTSLERGDQIWPRRIMVLRSPVMKERHP